MIIPIDPIVMTIGPLGVRWFGLLALLGLGLAVWRSLGELDQHRLSRGVALDAFAWGLPAGLVVARLAHVLAWWDFYLTHAGEIWRMDLDGLSVWGGLLGGGVVVLARLQSTRDPPRGRRVLDVMAPNVMLGIAVGRLGAFLDGHGQGLPSDLPWATQYASRLAATPDFGVSRHPAQVYDAIVAIAAWLVVSHLPRRLPSGSRLAACLVLYATARVLLGGVWLDPAFLFGLQLEQLLALGALAFGLLYGLQPVLVPRRATLGPAAGDPPPRPAEDSLAA